MKKLKKLLCAVSAALLVSSPVNAEVGKQLSAIGEVPKSVQCTPYADTGWTSVYAPWLKLMHITTKGQKEKGEVGGESCQQIRTLAVSPHDDSLVMCGTDTNGLWKTENGGRYWYKCGDNSYDLLSIQDIFFHPYKADTVYMISASNNSTYGSRTSAHDGIYRSRDRGETWEHVFHSLYGDKFFDKLIACDAEGNLYTASGAGVFVSHDDGDTWENLNLLFEETDTDGCGRSISVSPDGQKIIAAYGGRYTKWDGVGLYCSADGGKSWTKTAPSENMAAVTTEIYPADDSKWIVGFTKKGDSQPTGMYQSSDFGKTWQILSELPEAPSITTFGAPRADGSRRFYVQLDNIVYPMRYSDDGGVTWQISKYDHTDNLNNQYTGYYAQGFDVSAQSPAVVYSAMGGVYKSSDGGENFVWSNSGISGLNVAGISFDKDNKMYLSCVDIGLVCSDNSYTDSTGPTFFSASDTYVNNVTTADPDNPLHLISYCYSSWREPDSAKHLFESYDGGKTLSVINTEAMPTQSFIQYDSKNHDIIYTNDYTSTDRGKTWTKNAETLAAVSPVNEDVYYSYRGTGAQTEVWISKDKGGSWEQIGKVGFAPRNQISGAKLIYPDVADADSVYVVGEYAIVKMTLGHGIVKTLNKSTGAVINGGGYWSFAQNPKNPNHLLAGQTGDGVNKNPGLIESLDGGDTWHVVPGIAGHRVVYYIKFSDVTDEAFVCSMTGIMKYDYNAYKSFLDSKITVVCNGSEISLKSMPYVQNGQIMIPAREVLEMIGASVKWNGGDQSVTATLRGKKLTFKIGSDTATVGKGEVLTDEPSVVKDGITYIPIRLAAQAFPVSVGWSVDSGKIVIDYK